MAEVSDFVKAPSEEFLDRCTKEQLLRIADHFEIEVCDKRLKDTIKSILKVNLSEMGVLAVGQQPDCPTNAAGLSRSSSVVNLTFEQQKELLLLQLERDQMRQTETEKQFAIEKLRHQTEQAKLSLQQYKLDLIKSGKSVSEGSVDFDTSSLCPGSAEECFDVLGNLRLLPKFNEKDPETFFSLFERVADTRKWPESSRTLMPQCA